ncbi:hypothetical protein [Sorangium sp. So ce1182]|uniref:hypothetical protein n=1 Tax=Sorangium sp. So ce1182 TaxID=3133334 RepID=UPI003F609EE1
MKAINTKRATITLPESEATAPGDNGLFRLNYFNGRMLTAEALRKEQVYWDHRARLLGEVHPAGVAWGLGVGWSSGEVGAAPHRSSGERFSEKGGVPLNSGLARATLEPGLAFDGAGQPIVVGAPFQLDFKELTTSFVSHQVVVVDGGTQFSPCVCLAPVPSGKWTAGPSLPPGPYLLVIRPTETPSGEAKVYNHACATSKSVLCEADGFRGGFSLSLARFPVDVPLDGVSDIWTLRSVLSSYYFDVFEHSLIARWKRPFPLADGQVDFGAGTGRLDQQATAVPLAMVYLGSNNCLLFLDPWIPRRPLASTAASAWSANLRGAPAPSACIARLHQFQGQLQEALAAEGALAPDGAPRSLYELGFRSIPPFGFLPIPERPQGGRPVYFDDLVVFADRHGRRYFKDTNVFVYGAVAVHDDDLFEDMVLALEKDPIELRAGARDGEVTEPLTVQELRSLLGLMKRRKKQPPPAEPAEPAESVESAHAVAVPAAPVRVPVDEQPAGPTASGDKGRRSSREVLRRRAAREGSKRLVAAEETSAAPQLERQPAAARVPTARVPSANAVASRDEPAGQAELVYALRLLRRVFMPSGPLTMERLINREIELVKLVIPMEGQKRVHPIVGAVKADLSVSPFGVWPLLNQKGSSAKSTRLEALLGDVLGTTAKPHGFVLYVKQRLVLLDVLYILLDAALDLLMFLVEVLTTATMAPSTSVKGGDRTIGSKGMELLRGVGLDEQFLRAIAESFKAAYDRDPAVEHYSTRTLRGLVGVRPLKAVGALVALFANDTTRSLTILLLLESARELGFSRTWDSYDAELNRLATSKKASGADAEEAVLLARDEAIDLLLREHSGFGLLKLLAISLSDTEFTELEDALQEEANRSGKGKATLGQEIFYASTYDPWNGNEAAAKLFLAARRLFGERPVSELAGNAQVPGGTINTALLRTADEDKAEWGNDSVAKIIGLGGPLVAAASDLSGRVADPAFWSAYDRALQSADDVGKALAALVADNSTDKAYQALLTTFNALGGGGFTQFVTEARKIGGV